MIVTGRNVAGRVAISMVVALIVAACSVDDRALQLADSGTTGGEARQDAGGTNNRSDAMASSLARITLAPAPGASPDFGMVASGRTADQTFLVTNAGGQRTTAVNISLSPAVGTGFAIVPGTAGDCQNAATTLAPGASCNIRVRFTSSSPDAKVCLLGVSTDVGGAPPPALRLTANARPGLATSVDQSFGDLEVGTTSSPIMWTISNDGSAAAAAPTLSNGNATELIVIDNGCTSPIEAGGSCVVTSAFRPAAPGSRTGTLTLSATASDSVTFTATANGKYRITVVKTGAGSGAVVSTPTGIVCGNACSFLVDPGNVGLQASTANADSLFTGWTGGGCSGIVRDCAFSAQSSTTVMADFSALTNNLVFVTSATFAANLGAVAAYDAACNAAASSAGLNGAASNAFVAFISDASSHARTRLGAARGWVRMDGKPFADLQDSLFGFQQVWNSVRFSEQGSDFGATAALIMTGTGSDGLGAGSGATCRDWTDASVNSVVGVGRSESGPVDWTAATTRDCGTPLHLLCMGRSKTLAVTPVGLPGKKVWLTNSAFLVGGAMTPDETCRASGPPGVITAAALIPTTTRAVLSIVDTNADYVRPDGIRVGTGADLVRGARLDSGIWQSGDSVYRTFSGYAWTGDSSRAMPGTMASTCFDWTNPAGTAGLVNIGQFASTAEWWTSGSQQACGSGNTPLYCVQTSP